MLKGQLRERGVLIRPEENRLGPFGCGPIGTNNNLKYCVSHRVSPIEET